MNKIKPMGEEQVAAILDFIEAKPKSENPIDGMLFVARHLMDAKRVIEVLLIEVGRLRPELNIDIEKLWRKYEN
jgi:hypothetical protein